MWRPKYSDLDSTFFVGSTSARKVAYAAAFGMADRSEYREELVLRNVRLIEGFSHVSVRESSAIEICKSLWGVNAKQTMDPALLCSNKFWSQLTDSKLNYATNAMPKVARCYLLDQNRQRKNLAQQLCSSRDFEPVMLPPKNLQFARPLWVTNFT